MLSNAHVWVAYCRSRAVLASAGAGLAEMGGLRNGLPQEADFRAPSNCIAKAVATDSGAWDSEFLLVKDCGGDEREAEPRSCSAPKWQKRGFRCGSGDENVEPACWQRSTPCPGSSGTRDTGLWVLKEAASKCGGLKWASLGAVSWLTPCRILCVFLLCSNTYNVISSDYDYIYPF